MNIWLIFVTEIKHVLRNKRTLTLMVLFPLILMLILGAALSGAFNNADVLKNIHVLYYVSEQSSPAAVFENFLRTGDKLGIRFREAGSLAKGIERIKNNKDACFIHVGSRTIDLYKNDHAMFQANLIEAILHSFIQRYQLLTGIAKVNPEAAARIIKNETKGNMVVETSLNGQRKPKAMDYYAVTMLTLIIMYSAITGSFAIKREILAKTAHRVLCSPIKKYEILTGKILGAFIATLIQVLIVIAVSKYLFKAYWGEQPGVVAVLLASEVIMAVSFGIGLAFLIRNQIALNGFLNLTIPLVVFLGGGYIPVDSFGQLFLQLAALSPLRWINKAMFEVIYRHDLSSVIPAVLINVSIAIVFIAVASFATRKEAFLK